MCKYEMDLASIVEHTERTRDRRTDGWMDRQTDKVKAVYPPSTSLSIIMTAQSYKYLSPPSAHTNGILIFTWRICTSIPRIAIHKGLYLCAATPTLVQVLALPLLCYYVNQFTDTYTHIDICVPSVHIHLMISWHQMKAEPSKIHTRGK